MTTGGPAHRLVGRARTVEAGRMGLSILMAMVPTKYRQVGEELRRLREGVRLVAAEADVAVAAVAAADEPELEAAAAAVIAAVQLVTAAQKYLPASKAQALMPVQPRSPTAMPSLPAAASCWPPAGAASRQRSFQTSRGRARGGPSPVHARVVRALPSPAEELVSALIGRAKG